jgi:hypothetical protein
MNQEHMAQIFFNMHVGLKLRDERKRLSDCALQEYLERKWQQISSISW